MVWQLGLQQHLAFLLGAPRPTRHLQQLRKQMLGRTKIAGVQSTIGIQNHHQIELGKIMAFGQHLRPYQHIHGIGLYLLIQQLPILFATGGVAVDAHDIGMRHQGFERLFHPLRALPKRGQIAVVALGAKHRHRLAQITMVAAQLALILVPHHFGRAIGAIKGVATRSTRQHRRKTTPIQIHQRHATLLPVFQQCLFHRLTHALFQRQLAHINDVNFWQHRLCIGPLRQA